MRFSIPSDRFALAVQAAAYAASSRGQVEILRGSHWHAEDGKLSVSCTDMQSAATAVVDADVQKPGSCVVTLPTAAQLKTLKALAGETVTLEAGKDGTVLTAGLTRCTVQTAPVEDYPSLLPLEDVQPLDAAAFAGMLASVLSSAGSDESRPVLCGTLMDVDASGVLTCAATDSYRLRVRTMPTALPESTGILPAAGLGILARYLKRKGAELAYGQVDDQRSGFRVSSDGLDVTLTLRKIDAQFPNWRQLIPDGFPVEVSLPREQTIAKVGRLTALVSARGNAPLRMRLEPGSELHLSLEQVDELKAEDVVHYVANGRAPAETLEVGVNPQWLTSGLGSFTDDEVTLGAINPLRPMLVTGSAHGVDGATDCYLLMPIRLAG